MKCPRKSVAISLAVCISLLSRAGQSTSQALKRHWTQTTFETLWTSRYLNCDYGYSVTLPNGVVAHGALAPSPNHGFLVALPNVGTRSRVDGQQNRLISIDASYNVSDAHALSDLVSEQKGVVTKRDRVSTKIATLSALQVRSEYGSGENKAIEVTTIALRRDIVYTFTMRTDSAGFVTDEVEYQRIVSGFKLLPLPQGQCSSG